MSIVRVRVGIRGTRALVWHAFTPEAISLDGRKERTGVAGNDPEEWRKTYLATPERQLYLLPTYVFGCVRNAAKFTKVGRGSIQAKVAATLLVDDERVLVDRFMPQGGDPTTDQTQPVYIDVSSVRNPATGARNVRYRIATQKGWTCSFHLLFDKTIVTRDQMAQVIKDGGQLVGLGDGRAVGYGRFAVESFEEVPLVE